jgi:UDP-2,3-diacylglucosamine hydrolase
MNTAPKLGVLAGGGRLPAQIIDQCRLVGRPCFVIAIEGQADSGIVEGADHVWLRLGAGGKILNALREAGVEEVVMAGAIRRPSLSDLRPDMYTAAFLARTGAAAFGDDGLLRAVIYEIEERFGLHVVGVDAVLPEILAPQGRLAGPEPDEQAMADIRRGFDVARGIGALDVGQGAVVQQGIVLAVEASEGTNAMLERCGSLARPGPGGVLVKARKPVQEFRTDLPTVGPETVRAAAAAGLRGIAIEAAASLIVDRAATIAAAEAAGIFLIGVVSGGDSGS